PDTSHFFRYLASCFFRYLSFSLSCFWLLVSCFLSEELIMDKKDLKHYEKILQEELQKLRKDSGAELPSTDDDDVQDLVDMASSSSIKVVEQGLSAGDNERIRLIELALNKIKDGSYGKCIECGKDIEKERLESVPYATKCVSCKKKEGK
ncbi:MAG: TraR/DksA family transcriptional regulator, partial [Candidatus Hydrogenedentota bacterium]